MDGPIDSIEAYCRAIGIAPPKHPHFDIRRFEDNMRTVKPQMDPFKHELFALALKLDGRGSVQAGLDKFALDDTPFVFFNSPYQLLGWQIVPDWTGYYIMFTRTFASVNLRIPDLIVEFPFLRLDRAIPFEISPGDVDPIHSIFRKINDEYHGEADDKFGFIASYTNLLFRHVKRIFNAAPIDSGDLNLDNATAEYRLVSRFQVLLEEAFYPEAMPREQPLSVSEIADRLFVHPNYLSAILKRATGQTAKDLVDRQAAAVARRLLAQPEIPIKEVAADLGFAETTHFSRFFRRVAGQTPTDWRDDA